MNDRELKESLERAFPDTPACFHRRVAYTAERIAKDKEKKNAQRILRPVLICTLALCFTGGALAAMNHYGVFNFNRAMGKDYYYTLPGAEDLIRYDLCQAQTGNLIWQVKEAAYDGRVLRILYSVRDTAADAPITGENPYEQYHTLCEKAGVWLECDSTGEIFVNGVGVDLWNVEMRPGQENGEIEGWIDCRLTSLRSGEALRPEGDLSVSMPYRYYDEAVKSTGPDCLSFTMDVGDAASCYAVALPEPTLPKEGVTVRFTDLHFSPVTVSIDLEATVEAAAMPAQIGPFDDQQVWEIVDLYFPELYDYCSLENSRGEALGRFRERLISAVPRDDGGIAFMIHLEFAPSDKYTEIIYLVQNDLRLAIPLNTVNR